MSDVALACLQAFTAQLVSEGLGHAWVCPGSRSTPIALALARTPGVTVHVTLDERSAAFAALGASKASGRATVVACTSGTAAANMFPAVVEASMAKVSLIVLTADRPPELQNTGANQTIDQLSLYGSYAQFVETGVPADAAGAGKYWRTLAVAASESRGPTHFNIALREPLIGAGDFIDLGDELPDRINVNDATPNACDITHVADLATNHPEGIIIAGGLDGDHSGLIALSEAAGWPLIAEPMSQLRLPNVALASGQILAASPFAQSHCPEVVFQVGDVPISRALQSWASSATNLVTIDEFGRPRNPYGVESHNVHAHPGQFARLVAEKLRRPPPSLWTQDFQAADLHAREAFDAVLDDSAPCTELRVARDLARTLPDASTLVVGASMPVRDLDSAMAPRTGLRILSNRGVSGIDGFASTVKGVRAVSVGVVAGLCGDLTFLHDTSGLIWRDAGDIVIVVINNGGGAIFDLLPQSVLPEHERLFVTPHGIDLQKVSAAAGAGHQTVTQNDQLAPALGRALDAGGQQVVEAVCDRSFNAEVRRRLSEAVASAVS